MTGKIVVLIITALFIPFLCSGKVNYIERTIYGEWIFRYEIYSETPPPEYGNGSNSQTIISSSGNTYCMENRVCLDLLPASPPYPLAEGDYTEEALSYCNPYYYGYTDKQYGSLKELADTITRDSSCLHEAIFSIIRYVRENVWYSRSGYIEPLKVLRYGKTYCVGYANLAVILLRSAGIPARNRSCYMPPGKNWGNGYGGWHEYIEVFYPGEGWLSCDPQNSVFFVDPYHIEMSRDASYRRAISDEKHFTTLEYTLPEGFRNRSSYYLLGKRLIEGETDLYVLKGTVCLEQGGKLSSSSVHVRNYPRYFSYGILMCFDLSYDIVIEGNTFMVGFSRNMFHDEISFSINNCYMSIPVNDLEETINHIDIDMTKTDDGLPNPHILTFECRHPLTNELVKNTDVCFTHKGEEHFLGKTDTNGILTRYCKEEKEKSDVLTSLIFAVKNRYDLLVNPSKKLYFTFHNQHEDNHYISGTFEIDADYYRDAYAFDGYSVLGTVSCPGTRIDDVRYCFIPEGENPGGTIMHLSPLYGKSNKSDSFHSFYNKQKNETTIIQLAEGTFILYEKKNCVILSGGSKNKHIRVGSSPCNLVLTAKTGHKTPEILIAETGTGKAVQGSVLPVESKDQPIYCYLSEGEYYLGLNDVIMRKITIRGENRVQITLDDWSTPNYDLLRDYYSIVYKKVEGVYLSVR
jgi:hypothetical protein